MSAIRRVNIFEDLYKKDAENVKESNNIDASFLASLLGITQQELAETLDVSPTTASRKGIDSNNQTMKQWMIIFNLLVDSIEASEPSAQKNEIQVKMGRWLRMPNSHFGQKTPLEIMMRGHSRKVIRLLEQLNN